jgi:hypothetical protein
MGFTGPSNQGIADEIIIRNAEKGTTNEPKTLSLNFNWKTRYAQIMLQEKKERADLRSRTGAVPSEK